MHPIHHRLLMITASLLLTGASARGDEEPAAEPLELTRLREQFQHRVDQEMVPWREKYRKELQKLEDRLIAERKLVEALAVKKEREASAPLSTEPAAAAATATGNSKVPGSANEAREMLAGTVWLVYPKDDRKMQSPEDIYHFLDGNTALVFSTKRSFQWSAQSATDASIAFLAGNIEMKFNFAKSEGVLGYQGKEFAMVLAGRPADTRK
jgi:hypothetical protein